MNSATRNHECFKTGHDNIVENVYRIVDSKIQFIKYHTDNLIQSHLKHIIQQEPDLDRFLQRAEQLELLDDKETKVLNLIEDYSKTTRLLLFLRNYISEQNAKIIFALLTDDAFLHFSEKEIKIIIEGRATSPVI